MLWLLHDASDNRILSDVIRMSPIVCRIPNAMIHVPSLPYLYVQPEFLSDPIGESALNELHSPFQCDRSGCEEEMKVIGHDYELVKQEFVFAAVVEKGVYEQLCHVLALKERTMLPRTRSNEVDAPTRRGVITRRFRQSDLSG